jgi:hypothetical protein
MQGEQKVECWLKGLNAGGTARLSTSRSAVQHSVRTSARLVRGSGLRAIVVSQSRSEWYVFASSVALAPRELPPDAAILQSQDTLIDPVSTALSITRRTARSTIQHGMQHGTQHGTQHHTQHSTQHHSAARHAASHAARHAASLSSCSHRIHHLKQPSKHPIRWDWPQPDRCYDISELWPR